MLSLKKKSAAIAMSAGLALTLAACGSDDDATTNNGSTGSATSTEAEPVAEIDSLSGESTSVALAPEFVEGITGLGLTPAPLGDATIEGGAATFPITGGDVTYFDPNSGVDPYVQGSIEHEGSGLSLTAGETVVELENFVVDPANSVLTGRVTVNGEVAAESMELFFLDGTTLQPLQVNEADGTAVLQGTTVSLTQDAADALNGVFGTDALTEFFPVGTATITVALPA